MAHPVRWLFVYNADWSVLGGLRYVVERFRDGEDPCALCAVTHDGVRENSVWGACKPSLGVPVEGIYRNQLEPALATVVGERFPCVVADFGDRYAVVLEPEAIEGCRRRSDPVDCLADALRKTMANGVSAPNAHRP